MKGKELAELAMEYADFDFEFRFTDGYSNFPNVRSFEKLELCDIGYSDKVVVLTGDEGHKKRTRVCKNEKLKEVAKPLVDYIRKNYHPHVTVIVDCMHAEVLEGVEV